MARDLAGDQPRMYGFSAGERLGISHRQLAGKTPDLTISASAYDFIMLGTRKEDPDTLFFSRRLVVEGDTELGLIAKNTLDAVEMPKLALSQLMPGPVLEKTASHLLAAGR